MDCFTKNRDILNHHLVVSLGYNCYIKRFMSYLDISRETDIFDYVGTPMWAINQLIESDFKDLDESDDGLQDSVFQHLNIYGHRVVTNMQYYMRFAHDLKEPSDVKNKEFCAKLGRRIERFRQHLQTDKGLIFLRLQEKQSGRTVLHRERYCNSEYEETVRFAKLIGERVKCPYLVVYINKDLDAYDQGVLAIKAVDCDRWSWHNCIHHLKRLFSKTPLPELISK